MKIRAIGIAAAAAGALLVTGWAAGFLWFVQVASAPVGPPPHADGIVVLTGGSNRVEQGLLLLRQGAAPRLLVSGVAPGMSVGALAHASRQDLGVAADRVTLGVSAVSTHGNAEETVEWVRRYDLHSLIVVTAFYHMPRALAELRHALPGVMLYQEPVLPDVLRSGNARTPMVLLAKEYTKWLVVQLGVPHSGYDRRPGYDSRPGEGLK